jgi:hypothetical protein
MDTTHLLSASVTPVVLISACGLVTLALYNRLAAFLARIRAFHQQKIGLLDDLQERDLDEQQMLLDMLDLQIKAVIVKAKVIQKSLFCMLAAISAFLLCSVFAGATVLNVWFGIGVLGTGLLGITLFLSGVGLAMRELSLSLVPLEEENSYLEVVKSHRLAKSKSGTNLKIAKSA